ncbi:uncharacterized protein LOC144113359 [Amblyomma americanum]
MRARDEPRDFYVPSHDGEDWGCGPPEAGFEKTMYHPSSEKNARRTEVVRGECEAPGGYIVESMNHGTSLNRALLAQVGRDECSKGTIDRRISQKRGGISVAGRAQSRILEFDLIERMERRISENKEWCADVGRHEYRDPGPDIVETMERFISESGWWRRKRDREQSEAPASVFAEAMGPRLSQNRGKHIEVGRYECRAPEAGTIETVDHRMAEERRHHTEVDHDKCCAPGSYLMKTMNRRAREFRACHSSPNCVAASKESEPHYSSFVTKILTQVKPKTGDKRDYITTDVLTRKVLTRKIMSFGGITPPRPNDCPKGDAVLSYDPGSNSWSTYGFMPQPMCYHTAVVVGKNDVVVAGGLDPQCVTSSGSMQPSGKAFLFCNTRKRWIELPTMHRGRAFHAAVGCYDRMIVFGGIDRTGR